MKILDGSKRLQPLGEKKNSLKLTSKRSSVQDDDKQQNQEMMISTSSFTPDVKMIREELIDEMIQKVYTQINLMHEQVDIISK